MESVNHVGDLASLEIQANTLEISSHKYYLSTIAKKNQLIYIYMYIQILKDCRAMTLLLSVRVSVAASFVIEKMKRHYLSFFLEGKGRGWRDLMVHKLGLRA